MITRTSLALAATLFVSAGSVHAQRNQGTPGAVGDYSFFWTTATGTTPITSLVVNPGELFTVRLWLRETGTTGNVLSDASFGVASYDTRVTWTGAAGQLQIPVGSGGDTAENANVRTNPYASGGFTGPGVFRNSQTAGVNAAQAVNLARSVLSLNDSNTWVNSGTNPNVAGSLLVNQFTFQTSATLTEQTITAGQNTGLTNWQYGLNGTTALYLDDRIGTAVANLIITPVPEPASVLAIGAVGMGAIAGLRRWRRNRTGAATPATL